jgi:zinc-finger-containing domain
MKLWCCGCEKDVEARLTSGAEVYPHRPDLAALPFWRCDACGNWVGCHWKTQQRTKPLGCIPTPELKKARNHIHALIDPLWRNNKMRRCQVYQIISGAIGYRFHSAEIRSIEEARRIYRAVQELIQKPPIADGEAQTPDHCSGAALHSPAGRR